ncbi:UDP-glycosyltransferase 71K1-like [Canna indica]|uniref:UDP-glycosyltransferase 71K1-like n=1 Tax=Canna indica TaxID=4628 RepID=A0AAQ3KL08_9LILI|nr:UDP-glycosyltransferase 71K1-like [Canna indica]
MPSVFPVGPLLVYDKDDGTNRHECLAWLDQQPVDSVVFLCFGSKGCFEAPQVAEMAAGLECSGHRFLWMLRVPSQELERTMCKPADADLNEVLPEGFAERTKGRGMVWPSWAPQAAILAHPAVGVFVTHCGWNSCLESLQFGVPLLGWPLFAEQHLNAVVMDEDMGVALQLKVDRKKGNFVSAEELERGVRCLMGESEEGTRTRAKAKEMMLWSRKALEEGGSSFANTERLVKEQLMKEMVS